MNVISPSAIRYIKLGREGIWEESSLKGTEQVIRLGYESPHHNDCLSGNWSVVGDYWKNFRNDAGAATRDINQVRDFYEMDENTLWITFYNRMLFWCFADSKVVELEDDRSRIRRTKGAWRCTDINGKPLAIQNIDGRVTKVVGFRGTICGISEEVRQYLVDKINGKSTAEVMQATQELSALTQSIAKLIKGLWWKDFELLTDLIFARSGWQRISVAGGTDKSIDLDLLSPVTGKQAFVQVKSEASLQTLMTSIEHFQSMGQYEEFYFVVHTGSKEMQEFVSDDTRVHVLNVERLAEL
ncbi:MAG: restriction endonuclease, partial [Flavisolibacter sp.]